MGSVITRDCSNHWCDGCKACSQGRCCRTDDPQYRLPELGEIQPFYGELGVRNDWGDKVECHVCGDWFVSVASHAWVAHDLTAKEYRAAFGLSGKGLISEDYRARMSASRKASYKGHLKPTQGMTKEQRKFARRSLEGARTSRETAYRTLIPAAHSPETVAKMRATKARQSQNYAVDRKCAHCGRLFNVQRWDKHTTCSPECRSARASALGREHMAEKIRSGNAPKPPAMTEEIKAKLSEKAKARWEVAGSDEREAARARLLAYKESLSEEELRDQRRRAGSARAAHLRMPHPCTAGCGTIIPTRYPLTCSPECRKKVRQETARRSAAKRVV